MKTGTIYSASDKSLFDALNQKNVTNSDLRELFLSRGILVSRDTPRRQIALHFSRLTHDFYDYQHLARLFGGGARRDRLTSVRIGGKADLATFEVAALELKEQLEASGGASVRVVGLAGNKIDVELKYQAVHFNKSEFRQVVSRSSIITIEKDGTGLIVHRPANDETQDWVEEIVQKVEDKIGEKLSLREINLPPSIDVAVKNSFFSQLIRKINGFNFIDVSDVYVTKPKPKQEEIGEEDDEDAEGGDPGIHISKASLRGEGVLQSEELKLLSAKGFYISRIVWTAKQHTLDSDIYEFEAQFSDPDECRGFSYLPRGFYRYQAPNAYNETRTGFSRDEDQRLGKLIEAAARETLQKLPGVVHD